MAFAGMKYFGGTNKNSSGNKDCDYSIVMLYLSLNLQSCSFRRCPTM